VRQRLDRDHRGDPAALVRHRGRVDGRRHCLAEQIARPFAAVRRQPDRGLALLQAFPEPEDVSRPVLRQAEPREPLELLRQRGQAQHLADAVSPQRPVAAGHRVPLAALEDDPVRLQDPGHIGRRDPAAVADLDSPLVPDGVGDRVEVRRGVAVVIPAGRVEEEPLGNPRRPLAKLRWQRRVQLEPRGGQHRAQAELGRRARHPGELQRLRLGGGQPGQPGPVPAQQLVAAGRAGVAVDRHPRLAQRLDVTVDRPHRHLELGRQLGRGQPPAGLQQQQNGNKPARAHNPDNTCQGWLLASTA
jgi:hypothetical protein